MRPSSFSFLIAVALGLAACGMTSSSSDNVSDAGSSADGPVTSTTDGGGSVSTTDSGTVVKKDSGTTADASVVDSGDCSHATEGEPCAPEGRSCSSPCTDPCQFCNGLVCQSGKWAGMEAFPLPQNECEATFACGDSTCTKGQYCLVNHPGVPLADGGTAPPSYACVPLDAKCAAGCSCAMQAAQSVSSCQPQNCDANGGPVVQCYGI